MSSVIIYLLASLTVVGQLISTVLIFVLLFSKLDKKNKFANKIADLVSQNYVAIILLVTSIATFGSLSFSEILEFVPCKLCWFQRIFMYPQFVISGVALFTNDDKIKKYILSLSIVGFLIGVYHILVQQFPQILECSDEVAKCSFKEFATFGYVTIPVMSVTAFSLLVLISLINLRSSKKK